MMRNQLSTKQILAIKNLESAIKQLGKVGIQICGMDNNIYYATNYAIQTADKHYDNYCEVAEVYQQYSMKSDIAGDIKTGNVYMDSGGW